MPRLTAHHLCQALRHFAGLIQRSIGQADDKLLPAKTDHPVLTRPQSMLQALGNGTQHRITHRVTVPVIDALEVVDIRKNNAEGPAFAHALIQLQRQALFHGSAVVRTSEHIHLRQSLDLFHQLGKLLRALLDQAIQLPDMAIQLLLQMVKALHDQIDFIAALMPRTLNLQRLAHRLRAQMAHKVRNLAQRQTQVTPDHPGHHDAHQCRKNQIARNHMLLRFPQQIAVEVRISPDLDRA